MDDAWPRALFTKQMTDLPDTTIAALCAACRSIGPVCLAEIEDAFYAKLASFRREHQPVQEAA